MNQETVFDPQTLHVNVLVSLVLSVEEEEEEKIRSSEKMVLL